MIELPKHFAPQKLANLSPKDRFALLEKVKNSKLVPNDERQFWIQAVRDSGPLYDGTAIRHDDPMSLMMGEIINSDEGRTRCLKATEDGLPALAGIEPAIVSELGSAYGAHNASTNRSGVLVGEMMASLGYETVRQIPMPAGSVAKSATFYARKR